MTSVDRRTLLTGAALSAAACAITPAGAAAPPSGKQAAAFYRYRIGDFELTRSTITPGSARSTKIRAQRRVYRGQKALADSFSAD